MQAEPCDWFPIWPLIGNLAAPLLTARTMKAYLKNKMALLSDSMSDLMGSEKVSMPPA